MLLKAAAPPFLQLLPSPVSSCLLHRAGSCAKTTVHVVARESRSGNSSSLNLAVVRAPACFPLLFTIQPYQLTLVQTRGSGQLRVEVRSVRKGRKMGRTGSTCSTAALSSIFVVMG